MESNHNEKGQKSIFGAIFNLATAAVMVAVVLPLMVISIIVEGGRKNKEGLLALLSSVLTFSILAGSGLAMSACALGFDWDKKRDFEDPEVLAEVEETDADADRVDQEIPKTCQTYEKLCEVESVPTCIDPDTDRNHCGGCGIECSETQICAQGVCDCPSGKSACGTECYDFLNEVLACGGCGNVCEYTNAGASCEVGECRMGECLEGFYDCNEDPADGCESEMKDLANCGGCGVSCEHANADSSCDGGTCEFLGCLEGFGDCDDDTANGCEADLNTDAGNCGGCGTVCGVADPLLRGCSAGTCACACGNGICDDERERVDCPQDCPYSPRCGDGFCDIRNGAERLATCPVDCTSVPNCGQSGCQPANGESFNTCADCSSVVPVLEDGICGPREDCSNSQQDCGNCNSCET